MEFSHQLEEKANLSIFCATPRLSLSGHRPWEISPGRFPKIAGEREYQWYSVLRGKMFGTDPD